MTYILTFISDTIFGICACALLWWAVAYNADRLFKDDDHRKN
jgi:hypothetical protein